MMDEPVSVSAYCEILNSALSALKAKVIGEVSGYREWQGSGHAYFSLRDEEDESILSCAMWRSNYILSGIRLEDGMKIIANGKPSFYKKNGRLSFIVDTLELVGEGALKKKYDELKAKLKKEGIFAPEKKRPIPRFLKNIGVITSIRGAVIHDFQNNLGRHGFNIKFIDSLVEGVEAAPDLLRSIRTMRKQEIDALVIMRGGGSLQSLAAFDNEVLVREISDFPVPVIAGIGHHQDVPLMAMAADLAASTPTATANLINLPWTEARRELDNLNFSIFSKFRETVYAKNDLIRNAQANLKGFFDEINERFKNLESMLPVNVRRLNDAIVNKKRVLNEIAEGLNLNFRDILKNTKEKLINLDMTINLNDPHRLLKLGYSIAMKNNRVIKNIAGVIIGDNLDIFLSDGTIRSKVTENNGKK